MAAKVAAKANRQTTDFIYERPIQKVDLTVNNRQTRKDMKSTITILSLGLLLASNAVFGQSTELYVFKNERLEHLKKARKERKEAREKAVQNDFYMRVRTQTSISKAKMEIAMKKAYNAVIQVTDMNGALLDTVFEGQLAEGQHEFYYEPEGNLRKPFVCRLMLDGKTEAMKVVKFNAF